MTTIKNKSTRKSKEIKEKPMCNICCECINNTTHKLVSCMYCEFEACRSCCQTYILNESIAKCMNSACGREWSRKFISDSFTASFVSKEFKSHRENVLYEREQALLPATQPHAEYRIKINNLDQERAEVANDIRKLKMSIRKKKHRITNESDNNIKIEMTTEVKNMKKLAKTYKTNLENIQYKIVREHREFHRQIAPDAAGEDHDAVEGAVKRKQFIKPCPADECRGFLNIQWKCGLCSLWTCPDCHVLIGESKEITHTCDPNNVETAKMLKAETKSCPKCFSSIYKIDGCDQMWCTQCHTAFSWKTGTIEKQIHNPHYYDWLRKTQGSVPRNPLDVPCGEERQFGHRVVVQIYDAIVVTSLSPKDIDKVMIDVRETIRNILHLTQSVIPGLQEDDYEGRNRELRIDYLLNSFTEEQFKKTLQQREKKRAKQQELRDIYNMMATTGQDIMFRFLDYLLGLNYGDTVNTNILLELDELTIYANGCLSDINKTYNSTKYIFLQHFRLVRETLVKSK